MVIRALNGEVVDGCCLVVVEASDRQASPKHKPRGMKHVSSGSGTCLQ